MRRFIIGAILAVNAVVLPASAQSQVPGSEPYRILGFADLGYLATGRDVPDGFRQGRLLADLIVRPAPKWTFLAEASALAEPDEVHLSLERLLLGYELGRDLHLSLGRYRTPIGYWNANVHPAASLRTTIDPPALLDPARGVLPLQAFGVRAEGARRLGPIEAGLVTGVANGRGPGVLDPAVNGDADGDRAWFAGLDLGLVAVPALRLGAGRYHDRVTLDPDVVDERITSAFAAWTSPRLELIAEYTSVRHSPVDGPVPDGALAETVESDGYFVQAATRLSGSARGVRPYMRYEELDIVSTDPLLAPHGGDYRGVTTGVRLDFASFGALKAEYRNERFDDADDAEHSLALQLAITLPGGGVADPSTAEPPIAAAGRPNAGSRSSADSVVVGDIVPIELLDSAATGDSVADQETDPDAVDEESSAPPSDAERAAMRRARAVAVVVNPGTPVEGLSLRELRRILHGDRQFWSGSRRVVLVLPSLRDPQRGIVTDRLYRMSETDFRHFWLSRIFRSTVASGPKMVADLATARRLVAALDGAIGIVPATQVGDGMRVLPIDGMLPGEPGYPLQ